MQTLHHQQHIARRVSRTDCQECRADCERRFLSPRWPGYRHVSEYLAYVKPRLLAIKAGEQSANARHWQYKFITALQRRITLKGAAETGRKQCDSYLERLGQFPRSTENAYLRRFAQRGASALH